MMIENPGPRIQDSDVDVLEKSLGFRLASDYREFLLRHNGGLPMPDTIDIAGLPDSPTDVQVFFGIGRAVESSGLLWNFSHISERCPENQLLPIACDSGGSRFCLKVEQGVTEGVVFCDFTDMDCPLYFVATNFSEFLQKLRELDE